MVSTGVVEINSSMKKGTATMAVPFLGYASLLKQLWLALLDYLHYA